MKILYLHVPKTAGSSINQFFLDYIDSACIHIEGAKELTKEFCESYEYISGHVSFNRMNNILDLRDWTTIATFRDPLSYVISHLKWVRKLVDRGEEKRFNAHPEIFQKIAKKMLEFDFSNPIDIKNFILWLESINFYYFHNTQMHYMLQTSNQGSINKKQINKAIRNLRQIDYVGIQEESDRFMKMLSHEFNWKLSVKHRVNVNKNNYGFDINNLETQKALLPLYEIDSIIYAEAKDIFERQKGLHNTEARTNIIGYIDSVNKYKIVGWARSKDSLKKVKLELIVNDIVIQSTQANLFRQGLKTKKIHPNGSCGFRFILDKPIDTTNLKIKVVDTDISLKFTKKISDNL